MEVRLIATRYIWVSFAFMMIGLFISATFTPSGLGLAHVIIAAVLAIAAFLGTGMVWNWGDASNHDSVERQSQKQKRGSVERLVDELDTLTEDDLQRLRARLSGDVREALTTPPYGLNDDGELLRR